MASDPILVDDLVKDVTFLILNHEEYDPNTDRQVRRALDAELQCIVAETQFTAFKKYTSFETEVDRHTYSMPDDFVQVLGYGLQYADEPHTTLDWIMERDWIESEGERDATSGDPNCFWITHKNEDDGLWRFRMHPTEQTARTINLCYLSMPKSIATTVYGGDQVLDPRFPTQHVKKALVAAAALHLGQYLDGETKAYLGRQKMEAIKDLSNKSEPVAGNIIQKRAYGGPGSRSRYLRGPTVNILSIRS